MIEESGAHSGDKPEHFAQVTGELTIAQQSHAEHLDAVEQHMAKARGAASVLVTRARLLVRNGVDLRHPERVSDFINDQIMDAVKEGSIHDCGCAGAQGAAAVALLASITAELAGLMEGRE